MLVGPDQLTCQNGTIRPHIFLGCFPIHCYWVQSPKNGNANLKSSGLPKQNSLYTFTCTKNYWLDGPDRMVCKSGKWQPSKPPICRPMPCNNLPCINGGTCTNTNTHEYHCKCTKGWQGKDCERRKVSKDTLEEELKTFIKNSGGACKPSELHNYLGDYHRGRYPFYMWLVHCNSRDGYWRSLWYAQAICLEYSTFVVCVAWQDICSQTGTVNRYYQGKTKAKELLSSMNLVCDLDTLRDKVDKELKKINLDYTMSMVMRDGWYSYSSDPDMVFSIERHINCPNPARKKAGTWLSSVNPVQLADNIKNGRYSSTRRETRYLVLVGARTKSERRTFPNPACLKRN